MRLPRSMFDQQPRSPFDRQCPPTAMWLVSCVAVLALACGHHSAGADDTLGEGQIQELVAQLGSKEFVARERATERLIRIGLPAIEFLEEGLQHPDREIRHRVGRILAIVTEVDFKQRLEAFLMDPDGQDYNLPGWDQYRDSLGDDFVARELFVEMQKAEPRLMATLEEQPGAVADRIRARAREMYDLQRNPLVQNTAVPLASTMALLFAAGHEGVHLDDISSTHVYNFCLHPNFRAVAQDSPRSDLIRRMLANYIPQVPDAHQGLQLAMQYELPEGLVPAARMLEARETAPPHVQLYAILVIARFGGQEHVELLESLLDDRTVFGGVQEVRGVRYQTQVRDVALASLWHLVDEDPKDHGFDRLESNQALLFNTSTLGFGSDEERQQARQNWEEFRQQQLGQPNAGEEAEERTRAADEMRAADEYEDDDEDVKVDDNSS